MWNRLLTCAARKTFAPSRDQNLQMHVVAEGVETDTQSAALKAMGCEQAQGFLFSRPVKAADAEHLVGSFVGHLKIEKESVEAGEQAMELSPA